MLAVACEQNNSISVNKQEDSSKIKAELWIT